LSILDRLEEIRINERLNKKEFEGIIGKSSGYIGTLKKNKGVPGSDVIIKVSENFANYNMDWVISGRGDMLKSENNPSLANDEQDDYKVSGAEINSIRQDIRAVNENLLALNEGMNINMERLAKGVDRGLKNDLKVIQFIEKINVDDITRTTNSLRKLIEK